MQVEGKVNVEAEIFHLRSGVNPTWERPHLDGTDITDRLELWTPYQRKRREPYRARVAKYRADGLLDPAPLAAPPTATDAA